MTYPELTSQRRALIMNGMSTQTMTVRLYRYAAGANELVGTYTEPNGSDVPFMVRNAWPHLRAGDRVALSRWFYVEVEV